MAQQPANLQSPPRYRFYGGYTDRWGDDQVAVTWATGADEALRRLASGLHATTQGPGIGRAVAIDPVPDAVVLPGGGTRLLTAAERDAFAARAEGGRDG